MKILHILTDGPTDLSQSMIPAQGKENEIKVVDLTKKEASYESIVDDIFSSDRVMSW